MPIEELFDLLKLTSEKAVEQSNPESLRGRRLQTVEHCVGSGDLDPFSSDFRSDFLTRLDRRRIGHRFGAL